MEVWKDIEGYEGLYQISNLGRVKSMPKTRRNRFSSYRSKEAILKPRTQSGYDVAALYKDGVRENIKVHRLVAVAFIGRDHSKPWINHKNGIKTDNRVENLEWCTPQGNSRHAFDTGLNHVERGKGNPRSRRILQYKENGELIAEWYGVGEIKRELGINPANVNGCLHGRRRVAGGFIWKLG